MPPSIEILLGILLVCLIAVAVRLFVVIGSVNRKVDETRAEISGAVKQLDAVTETTNRVLTEEVAPTLSVLRETLTNVEVLTHALADTTLAVRRISQRADGLTSAPQLLALGGTVGKFVAHKTGDLLGGMARGVGNGLLSLFGRRKADAPAANPATELTTTKQALPANGAKGALPAPEESAGKLLAPSKTRGKSEQVKRR